MNNLKKLLSLCKCGVFLTVNEHRDYYISAVERLEDLAGMECPPEYSDDVKQKMIESDTIIELQFYPDTPIGSYTILHHDIDAALDAAILMLTHKQ